MANGRVHTIVGGLAGLGVYGFHKSKKKEKWSFWGATGAICLGALIALLPDILESAAKNPNHRQLFHSISLLGVMFLLHNKIGRDDFEKLLVSVGLSGYSSHLILDAFTPCSLPLL